MNPLTVVAFAGLAGQLPLSGRLTGVLLYAVAVLAGSLVIQVALATLGAILGAGFLRDPRRLALLGLASGVGLIAFAIAGAVG